MSEWLYPTAFSSWGEEEHAAIERVRKSGRWTAGPEVEAFEAEFAAYHGRKYAVMTNSGSSANLLAAKAFSTGMYRNRLGVVPAIAWSTTYAPFVQDYKTFFIADVDDTWNAVFDVDKIERQHPGFIVGCSVLGNPAYLKSLKFIANNGKIPFLEDNCESLGAMTPEGKLTGTYGDISTFSFFYSHQISAIEGGMLLTDDEELYRHCNLLCNHGNAGWESESFEGKYDFTCFGYNLRGLELHAAIGRAQLIRLPELIKQRRNNYYQFWHYALDLPIRPPIIQHKTAISPFGIAFEVLEGKEARSRLARAFRSAGIDCRPPTGGSFLKHAYGAPYRAYNSTPNADRLHDTAMFIGLAPYPIPHLIEKAIKVIKETL